MIWDRLTALRSRSYTISAVVSTCILMIPYHPEIVPVGHIQIDDPTFCFFCNEKMIAQMEAAGVDHEALLDTYIRAINICTAERPNDLTISVHMCRGNFKVRDFFPVFFDIHRVNSC